MRHSHLESLREIISGEPTPKPSEYRGHRMRSRLEVTFATFLDRLGEDWRYEPAIFGPVGQGYKPDFQILGLEMPCYIEVKPTIEDALAAKDRMAVIWNSHPDALLIVACAEGQSFFVARSRGQWTWFHERWVSRAA